MKKIIALLLSIFIAGYGCKEQPKPERTIHNQDFNWTITIPPGFENVSAEEWTRMQNKGAQAIEATYGETVENRAKTIFVFKSGQLNYLESNYQPFDTAVDGDYVTSCQNVNDMMYHTFLTQMPDVVIDSSSAVVKIDNLAFQTYKMVVKYPSKIVLRLYMFSRLFDKREFTVNIYYTDTGKGRQMLDAWRSSKFSRE